MINFQIAAFMTSASKLAECPPDTGAEVAFCGRSNAGKSSAINTLTRQGGLARVSKTPGRTQLLNFFELRDDKRLVDLPGYGYAKVPTSVRDHWNKHLDDYLRERVSLRGLVLLMDARHPLKPFDHMMIEWNQAADLPLHILLTKADKLKRGAQRDTLRTVQSTLGASASAQLFSSLKKSGLPELQEKLSTWLSDDALDTTADKALANDSDQADAGAAT